MKKTILLLFGGISEENYLSIRSAEFIVDTVDFSKYSIIPVQWQEKNLFVEFNINNLSKIKKEYYSITDIFDNIKFDCLYNLLHGKDECSGEFNGILEWFKINCIGNSLYTNFLGFNKFTSKLIFKHLGILTPDFQLIRKNEPYLISNIKFPIVVKPVLSGSSVGVKKVSNKKELDGWIKNLFAKGFNEILVEEFISGNEYCSAIIGNYNNKKILLPVAEIIYSSDIFDEQCKINGNYFADIDTRLSDNLKDKISDIGLKLHNFLKSTYITRTDFIVREEDIYTIEINTAPGLSSCSIVTQIMKKCNYTINDVLEVVLFGVL